MAATSGGRRGIPAMSPSQPILNLGRWALLVYRWRLARELIATHPGGGGVQTKTWSKDWRKEQ